jgi:hypothetical protein
MDTHRDLAGLRQIDKISADLESMRAPKSKGDAIPFTLRLRIADFAGEKLRVGAIETRLLNALGQFFLQKRQVRLSTLSPPARFS